MDAPPKSCNLDPAPTWLVKDTINELVLIVSHIVVTSQQSSVMPEKYKTSCISPLVKKTGLTVNRGCVVVLVMLDLTAAFETIDHAILLSRLFHRFGVTGAALEWFRSFLSVRHQVVRIVNEKSPHKDVTFGVAQGSVLGLLLSTAYIIPVGDIIKKFGLDYKLYADDTQLYVSLLLGGIVN